MIFESKVIPNGFAWTIVTKLGDILKTAEMLYGERDMSYTILGVECNQLDFPQTWFPRNRKNIVIQITNDCRIDMNRAVYQVAHEVIHCLSPIIGIKSNVLEEGLATHFSVQYSLNNGHGNWKQSNSKYENAMNLVKSLLKIDADVIKKIRQRSPNLSSVTQSEILKANPTIPIELTKLLIEKFDG